MRKIFSALLFLVLLSSSAFAADVVYYAAAEAPVSGQPQKYDIYDLVAAVDASGAPVQVRHDDAKGVTSAQLTAQGTQLTAAQAKLAAWQAAVAALTPLQSKAK